MQGQQNVKGISYFEFYPAQTYMHCSSPTTATFPGLRQLLLLSPIKSIFLLSLRQCSSRHMRDKLSHKTTNKTLTVYNLIYMFYSHTVTRKTKDSGQNSSSHSLNFVCSLFTQAWNFNFTAFTNVWASPYFQRIYRSFATRVSQLKIWYFWVIGIERNVCRCTFNRYSVITQFAKFAAGEQFCCRCTHRKLQHIKTFKLFSWKIKKIELWHCCRKWTVSPIFMCWCCSIFCWWTRNI